MKKKVYIWGAGRYGKKVLEAINLDRCHIEGFIDNDPIKKGKLFEKMEVVSFKNISKDYDMIIISIVEYYAVLYQLKKAYTDMEKVLVFFDEKYCRSPEYFQILDQQKWRIALLEYKVEKLEKILSARFNNIGYEIIDKYLKGGGYTNILV